MNIMHTMASQTRTTQVPKRRFYSLELKLQVVQTCAQPGASIAAVALQQGINANIVHRWIREHRQGPLVSQPQAFVPVTLSLSTEPEPVAIQPVAVTATAEIRMELRRGTSSVTVMWPSELASDCGAWLREWLR
jgi:transposase